jgi:hypothetical protein
MGYFTKAIHLSRVDPPRFAIPKRSRADVRELQSVGHPTESAFYRLSWLAGLCASPDKDPGFFDRRCSQR